MTRTLPRRTTTAPTPPTASRAPSGHRPRASCRARPPVNTPYMLDGDARGLFVLLPISVCCFRPSPARHWKVGHPSFSTRDQHPISRHGDRPMKRSAHLADLPKSQRPLRRSYTRAGVAEECTSQIASVADGLYSPRGPSQSPFWAYFYPGLRTMSSDFRAPLRSWQCGISTPTLHRLTLHGCWSSVNCIL